jgi:drug/metabolite transporter (DMT)-like permease
MTKPVLKDYFTLHFIVFIWGFTAILGELVTIPAVELVFYRTLIAATSLILMFYFQKKDFQVSKKELLKMLATGGIIAGHWILFFAAADVSKVSICLVGMATCTLWTSILEPIFHKRKMQWIEVFLGIVIVIGLYQVFASEFSYAKGLIFAIISAFLGAAFSIANSRLVRKHDPMKITLYEMIGAFACMVIFLPFYKIFFAKNEILQLVPTLSDWFWIIVLALLCTVYAYSMGVKLMKKFTPFAVNLTVNLEPVYGILLAYFLFNEGTHLSIDFYAGAGVILLAVFSYPVLMNLFKSKKISEQVSEISNNTFENPLESNFEIQTEIAPTNISLQVEKIYQNP